MRDVFSTESDLREEKMLETNIYTYIYLIKDGNIS